VSTLAFPTIQTYSDGSVVKWIESAAPGSTARPEHPSPTLEVAPADPGAAGAVSAAAAGSAPSNNRIPLLLSVIALVAAAVALGLTIVSGVRRRRARFCAATQVVPVVSH
jgi:hypothetical protein